MKFDLDKYVLTEIEQELKRKLEAVDAGEENILCALVCLPNEEAEKELISLLDGGLSDKDEIEQAIIRIEDKYEPDKEE